MNEERYRFVVKALKNKLSEILPKDSRAVLYGSRARGEANEESDWDIHILIPGKESLSITEIGDYAFPIEMLGWSLNECFSVMVYSHIGWAKRSFLPFYKNVEADKVILFNSMKP